MDRAQPRARGPQFRKMTHIFAVVLDADPDEVYRRHVVGK
jgi:hypothetical protein